ncbi:MAG: hypothetical protein J3Q66DRAFT_384792 [Benniella sp.]|nr:MAG: hypothetical protein J3Q66DRAFT_384792 [Benniella sp.]
MPRRASSTTIATPVPKRSLRSAGYVPSTVPIPNRNSFMPPRPRRSPYDKPADPKQQLIAFPRKFSSRRRPQRQMGKEGQPPTAVMRCHQHVSRMVVCRGNSSQAVCFSVRNGLEEEEVVKWDPWPPADKGGKWGLVETEEDTVATQVTPDVTLDEIDDQVEGEDALAIPGTPTADDIDIDKVAESSPLFFPGQMNLCSRMHTSKWQPKKEKLADRIRDVMTMLTMPGITVGEYTVEFSEIQPDPGFFCICGSFQASCIVKCSPSCFNGQRSPKNACLKRSAIWGHVNTLKLSENMRVKKDDPANQACLEFLEYLAESANPPTISTWRSTTFSSLQTSRPSINSCLTRPT